jgi:hypothetical protein
LGLFIEAMIESHDSNICDHLGEGIANEGITNKT